MPPAAPGDRPSVDDLSALVDTYPSSLAQGTLSKISRFVAASGSPGYIEVKVGKGGGGGGFWN